VISKVKSYVLTQEKLDETYAMVPKGFIRLHVLEALEESPKSGSEIIDQIEKHTNGFWKPSPGSIYPLLAWLQEKAYIDELPTETDSNVTSVQKMENNSWKNKEP